MPIKKLTLYPKKFVPQEPETGEAKKKRRWRWSPTKEKPDMKIPEKLPNFRELPPKYEQPAPPPEVKPVLPVAAPANNWVWGIITFFFIMFIVVIVIGVINDDNNGRGAGESSGGSVCPSSAPLDCGNGCCPYGNGGRTDVCCPGNKCTVNGKCPTSTGGTSGGGGGGGGGSTRQCIRSVINPTRAPSCNGPDGPVLPTFIDNDYIGPCSSWRCPVIQSGVYCGQKTSDGVYHNC